MGQMDFFYLQDVPSFFEFFDSAQTSFNNWTIQVLRGPIFHA